MITNLWKQVTLVCGNHDDPEKAPKMEPHEAATSQISRSLYGAQTNMFYSCPKYYPYNREEGEVCCRNHISMKEFENMLSHLESLIEDDLIDGNMPNLSGEKWKSKGGTEFRVLSHTDHELRILCLNRRSLWA